jgi:WD40 repeat protein
MEHTYLRYECADSFGVTVASASSKAPNSNGVMAFTADGTLLTVAGSCIAGFRLSSAMAPIHKLGHTLQVAGNMGTGKALNGDEMVCLACSQNQVATGWIDGAVRIFGLGLDDEDDDDRLRAKRSHCPANSLLDDASDCLWQSDPLLLNGHGGSPVRVVLFDADGSRLASGGSDGAVVLWDVVAESGLYRLLGHRGGITDVAFVRTTMDSLISCSLDCLIKVWDLEHQCCVQTIVSSSEVLAGVCRPVLRADQDDVDRWRLIAGGSDGHVRVWSVGQETNPGKIPTDVPVVIENDETGAQIESTSMSEKESSNVDDLCNFMGFLRVPPNVAASNEKVGGIQITSGGRYVGVLRGKHVDVFVVRSTAESQRKKARRLKRRQEKSKKKIDGEAAATTKSKKRGILDDDDDDDDDDAEDDLAGEAEGGSHGQHNVDPESIKTSDEFEYMATVRASQKLRGFRFCVREKGELCRIVCALATNALETHTVSRKEQVYV